MCEFPTVLSRVKHSCSFPPHTRQFPSPPYSTGTVPQTSLLQLWCQQSLGHSVFLILFTLFIHSYGPSQACHLYSINIYLLVLTWFIIAVSHVPHFLKCIPDPFNSCGVCWVVRSSLIFQLAVTPFFWTCACTLRLQPLPHLLAYHSVWPLATFIA